MAGILVEVSENFAKHHLGQIFFVRPPRQMRAHDFHDQWIKLANQRARRVFVPLAHALQAGRHIEADLSHGLFHTRRST